MSNFKSPDLAALIRNAAEDYASADPNDIASIVLGRIATAHYKEALALCLPGYVRVALAGQASKIRGAAKSGRLTSPERIRTWYAQQLGTALFCGGDWKFLRDCTPEDLHQAAADRYRKASDVAAEADRWTKVALFMEENDRATVARISEAELKSLMEAS